MNTYYVEGGIGKCVAFTAILPKLAERDGEEVCLVTPWPDCFNNSEYVKYNFDCSRTTLSMTKEVLESDRIFNCEPYKTNFQKGNQHLIESFCEITEIDYDESMIPNILASEHLDGAKILLEQRGITGRFMLVQFFGGQPPTAAYSGANYQSVCPARNYPYHWAQKVINQIKERDPELTIVNYALPNEPQFENTMTLEAPYIVWHEILKLSEGFIGIDSSLNQYSPSVGKRGVVIWGPNKWTQFGYRHNTNVNYFGQDDWNLDSFKDFEILDPRNTLVHPDKVVDLYFQR